jgi:hypothetical protein
MELDEDQKHMNYRVLIDNIKYIRDGQRITEDWISDQIVYLKMCREQFSDMGQMNLEISEKRWRAMAEDCELMLSQLLWEHEETKQLSIELYLKFCENIKRMLAYYATDDDLTSSIGTISM